MLVRVTRDIFSSTGKVLEDSVQNDLIMILKIIKKR